ncbi:hypothetical protein AB4571_03905 [Vibrio breoganii]|uniref:hypothetical protein n=1 Tax=Vibrio breoganii TaxID=553239 RepID=UPI000C84B22E|nr:hypothetical protein [Vibrio breoganii]PML19295.1 hypothetical protein BCT84_18650 [Vibrio breoganii]
MRSPNKTLRSGFTLVEMLIVASFMSMIMVGVQRLIIEFSEEAEVAGFRARLEMVRESVDRYYVDKVIAGEDPMSLAAFPSDVQDLVDDGYIIDCPPDDFEAGLCIDLIGSMPGLQITPKDMLGSPVAEIQFELLGASRKREKYHQMALMLPGFVQIDPLGVVTVDQHRPGSMPFLQGKVSTDGSTPMTSDWEFGPHTLSIGSEIDMQGTGIIRDPRYILGVEDVTLEGVNDRTLLTGLARFGQVFIGTTGGVTVNKHDCQSAAFEAKIAVWTVGTGYQQDLIDPTNVQVWAFSGNSPNNTTNNDLYWTIQSQTNVQQSGNTSREYINDAVVMYSTWCDPV